MAVTRLACGVGSGMTKSLTIAIDAMGGDAGPEMVIPALDRLALRRPDLNLIVFGDSARLAPLMVRHKAAARVSCIEHCDVAVAMDDKPSQALRRGRNVSSMWRAIAAVKAGEAAAAVSAGNTGALMAMATFILRTMPGIKRPAIAAIWPTLRGESIVLDVGATIGADAEMLVDFAIMGEAMARTIFHIERPTVGLLNIGVEEVKGIEEVKKAGRILRDARLPIEYAGFVEGDDLGKGTVDVVVTEGFTGNIALKTAEGTAKQLVSYLRMALKRTLIAQIGAWLAQGAFVALKEKMDPKSHNGGVFLGLNGIVVKSHGGTDSEGFAAAVSLAIDMVRNDIVQKIEADIAAKSLAGVSSPASAPAADA